MEWLHFGWFLLVHAEDGFMYASSTSKIIQNNLQSNMNNTNTLWSSSYVEDHIESQVYPHGFQYVRRFWAKQGGQLKGSFDHKVFHLKFRYNGWVYALISGSFLEKTIVHTKSTL
jgi:hypothetical protein